MIEQPLQVVIDSSVSDRFPPVRVGAFQVRGLRRAAARLDGATLLAKARVALQTAGLGPTNMLEDPRIREWRQAVARCKLKPSMIRSSAEQLSRRILSPGGFATGLPLVDAYCAVSAEHVAPIGGYDAERLPLDVIVLRLARPDVDTFAPLGGRAEDMPLREDVVVYACGDDILCYAFNHRDSQKTSLGVSTEHAVFVSEAVHECQWKAAEGALRELSELLSVAGAEVSQVEWATATAPRVTIG
jgi:DNA/RNA-binding domain of Phe-tRNA-synthetase-like protein